MNELNSILTCEQFLARAGTIYDMGLARPVLFSLLERWVDVVMREGHSRLCDFRAVNGSHGREYHQAQWDAVRSFWYGFGEVDRLQANSLERWPTPDAQGYSSIATLANDMDGYDIIRLAAILAHPCQFCAEDPKAWHTRSAFCPHR